MHAKKMMHLIISMESGSLNHELLKFFEYDSSVPTNSAFYQQRSKLSVSAFRHLPILVLHIDISAKPSKIDIVSIYYLCLRAVNELDWSDSE